MLCFLAEMRSCAPLSRCSFVVPRLSVSSMERKNKKKKGLKGKQRAQRHYRGRGLPTLLSLSRAGRVLLRGSSLCFSRGGHADLLRPILFGEWTDEAPSDTDTSLFILKDNRRVDRGLKSCDLGCQRSMLDHQFHIGGFDINIIDGMKCSIRLNITGKSFITGDF
ncbi:hypothetical protein IEQ34_004582 [Dendrobium chrysotoxum]|uniref:Uncharacterized protein n=1 Tax=Dendrobium chrysotoxum TaxID=161865 RepID=A0AAV7HHM7_DENCH|nr:hypothetical protein IEQ34_004582 [Dendrobium chrysotoxum]